uniref:Capsid protein n=1 Tax=Turdus naumanni CRESS-DNA-virus sp. TaxID=2815063 RepID=A0A8A4XD92_9VIRU|nr:MAG: capsid protein [Turdus naumanni CRESS-DNA-virus sp.]
MASIQDRYGTEAENKNDDKVVQTLWKFSPTSYDNEKIVVLPYAQYQTVAAAVGVTAPQQYKINSTYDPDLTGAGVQPLGRDTWAAIYNYYKVLETHVTLEVMELTDDGSGSGALTLAPSLITWMADITANPPSGKDALLMACMASKNSKQQKFGPLVLSDIITGRGSKTKKFEYHWDASQFDTSIIDNTKNEWTAVGSDPANINYFSVIYYNPNGVGARNILVNTKIEYLVAFKQINRTLLNTVN